ncbi:MAG: DUF885 domain-containing protein, partial [Planctomycetes bacterium]|nr:DUF885 domain-containing protein [Planctomycetota bacterium]
MTDRARVAAALVALASVSLPLTALTAQQDLRQRITGFSADLADLDRRYDVPLSGEAAERVGQRLETERRELGELAFDELPRDARIDWLLLGNHVERELERLAARVEDDAAMAARLPFVPRIVRLCEAWRRLEDIAAEAAATEVTAIGELAAEAAQKLKDRALGELTPPELLRWANDVQALRRAFGRWFHFRDGYDPSFSWWVAKPYEVAEERLDAFEVALRATVRAQSGDSSLVGDPIGEEALLRELRHEWIPYSPSDLVAIAEREFAWCDAELLKAARAMGCGEDWRQALEQTKNDYVAPGRQPALIRDLAAEAIAFLRARDLVTIPELAEECWRMRMMSPAAQRVNPFFLGGETIQVSFPTDTMSHSEKLMSLRSNNEHFCRATVHHELIP